MAVTPKAYYIFRIGQQVHETVPPFRGGTIRAIQGTGFNTVIWVNITGWHPVALRPSQLRLG
jgi:hypothetical protein